MHAKDHRRLGIGRLLAVVLALGIAAGPLGLSAAAEAVPDPRIAAIDTVNTDIQTILDALDDPAPSEAAPIATEPAGGSEPTEEEPSETARLARQKRELDLQIYLLYSQIRNRYRQIALLQAQLADQLAQQQANTSYSSLCAEKLQEKLQNTDVAGMEEALAASPDSLKIPGAATVVNQMLVIRELVSADRELLANMTSAEAATVDAQNQLDTLRLTIAQTRRALNAAYALLAEKQQESEKLLLQLRAGEESYQSDLSEPLEAVERLLPDMIQEQHGLDALFDQAADEAAAGEDAASYRTLLDDCTVWLYPLPQKFPIFDPFGWREVHPVSGASTMHSGADIGAYSGTEVYATRAGMVVAASFNDDYGNYVEIDHGDGYHSIYMHMQYDEVSQGEFVAAGQCIGRVGETGATTGVHLHFGVSYNGVYEEPMQYALREYEQTASSPLAAIRQAVKKVVAQTPAKSLLPQ